MVEAVKELTHGARNYPPWIGEPPAKENPAWGYGKLQGELLKPGNDIGRSTIRDVLKRQRIPPTPERGKQGSSWCTFLRHYRDEILACDFFTVETARLKTCTGSVRYPRRKRSRMRHGASTGG